MQTILHYKEALRLPFQTGRNTVPERSPFFSTWMGPPDISALDDRALVVQYLGFSIVDTGPEKLGIKNPMSA